MWEADISSEASTNEFWYLQSDLRPPLQLRDESHNFAKSNFICKLMNPQTELLCGKDFPTQQGLTEH